jgi:hypothetical protein
VRGLGVPQPNPNPLRNPSPRSSALAEHIRTVLKVLAIYGVTIVNAAAILYIVLRIWSYFSE